ncbi:MAG: antitoxin [Candidatus Rokuibacteriota bacterium]|nr:MAG: antitoxin [Candidatus Rokubacteria bacterium]
MNDRVYGMIETTVHLPDDLKRALRRVAAARGSSEAALIREAVRTLVQEAASPRPRLPLFTSGKPGLDRTLAGFGEG